MEKKIEAILVTRAEFEQLQQLRAIAESVAAKGVYYTLTNGRRCYFCEAETDQFTGEPPHKANCPVPVAQALRPAH